MNFKNWKEEDEEDGGAQGQDLEEMMRQMGGLRGAAEGVGAVEMEDLAKKPNQRPSLDDFDIDDEEDDMPDLE